MSQNNELTDLEKHRLKGKVKSVMETKYTFSGKPEEMVREKVIYQKSTIFDINGYISEATLYVDGSSFMKSVIVPGNDGRPSGLNEYKPDGTLNLQITYTYDNKGRISEALYDWEQDYLVGEICEYSDYYNEVVQSEPFIKVLYTTEYRGYVTEEKFLKPDGMASFVFTAKYDPRANKLESSYFHGNGRLSWRTKYTYDRYDNLIESRLFKDNRAVVVSRYKHQFDDPGNWTQRIEEREIYITILTEGLEKSNMVTERAIEYY